MHIERVVTILVSAVLAVGGFGGCRQQMPAADVPDAARPARPGWNVLNSFHIWVLDSAGDREVLDQIWSYLDDVSPGDVGHSKLLNLNGLRCGTGHVDDWPAVKGLLDRCQTVARTRTPVEKTVGLFTPTVLLTSGFASRTLFYYDRAGRVRGNDFGPSRLQLLLVPVGKLGDGRARVVFSPRLLIPASRFAHLARKAGRVKPRARAKTIGEELEGLSIVVDLNPDEFALLGPSPGKRPKHLVGSQLFERWERGQRHTFLVVVKPMMSPEMADTGTGK